VSDVSGLYRDIGIHFLPTRIADWSSPDDVVSAEDLLPELSEAIPLDDEDVIFGFIGQHLPRVDGFAEVGGRICLCWHMKPVTCLAPTTGAMSPDWPG
jgi:hypothetical protein